MPLALTTLVPVVDRFTVAAPASTNDTTAGLNRNTFLMLPPGWPPSWSFTGSTSRESYDGPPAALIAASSFAIVWSAATTPSSVAPSLSCTSSREMMSGEARFCTIPFASAVYLLAGSDGARFSTLYVATESWELFLLFPVAGGFATVGAGPLCWTVPSVVAAIR